MAIKAPDKLTQLLRTPRLTWTRIVFALAVAVTADALQFFLGAVPFIDQAIDLIAFMLTAWTLGFHLLLLPTFIAKIFPVIDMLPTWTACVIAVIVLRKQEQKTKPSQIKDEKK
jgi:hypothetical protein